MQTGEDSRPYRTFQETIQVVALQTLDIGQVGTPPTNCPLQHPQCNKERHLSVIYAHNNQAGQLLISF